MLQLLHILNHPHVITKFAMSTIPISSHTDFRQPSDGLQTDFISYHMLLYQIIFYCVMSNHIILYYIIIYIYIYQHLILIYRCYLYHPQSSPVMVIFQGRGGVPVARLGPLLHRAGDSVHWPGPMGAPLGGFFQKWMMHYPLPSGKRLHNYGKSPFLMGKSTINGNCP